MKKWVQTIGIGCIVPLVAYILGFVFAPDVYFRYTFFIFLLMAVPFSITGALIGKRILKNQLSVWLGALLGTIMAFRVYLGVVSQLVLD